MNQLAIDFSLPVRSRRVLEPGSQNDRILQHLRTGATLTPLEALNKFACFRLAPRILERREMGHDIKTEIIELPNGKRIAEYRL